MSGRRAGSEYGPVVKKPAGPPVVRVPDRSGRQYIVVNAGGTIRRAVPKERRKRG